MSQPQEKLDEIKLFVARGGSINTVVDGKESLMTDYLDTYYAVIDKQYIQQNPDNCYLIPDELKKPLNERDSDILSALAYFIEAGADVNLGPMTDEYSEFPLHSAVSNRDVYMVEYLLEKGADPMKRVWEPEEPEDFESNDLMVMLDELFFDEVISSADKETLHLTLKTASLLAARGVTGNGCRCFSVDMEKREIIGENPVLF